MKPLFRRVIRLSHTSDTPHYTHHPLLIPKDLSGLSWHWVVPPGEHTFREIISNEEFNLPFDTTLHFVSGHMHAYGKSVALVDRTEEKTLLTINTTGSQDKLVIENIEEMVFQEGLLVHKDHQYEIVAKYNNTTSEDVDGMAFLHLYFLDKNFQKPTKLADATHTEEPLRDENIPAP